MRTKQVLLLLSAAASFAAAGCRIASHNDGDSENVKIATPFGGMQVKTNEGAVGSGIGLPEYPGATLVKKDKDNGAADINMSFGNFRLRVKAVSYRTTDPADKVQAFYATALGHFGDVIQCSDGKPVGSHTETSQGLTCDKDRQTHISAGGDFSRQMELKAGSQQHQHIVAIEHEGDGTKFGLVAIDLPGHLSTDDKGESSQ